MKKYLCLFVCVFLCVVSACSPHKNIVNSETEKAIIDLGTYYRIQKGNINQVYYDIYNSKGEVVLSEKTDQPLEIGMINDNVVYIKIGMGTGITIYKYYSVDKNIFSKEFSYVLSNRDNLIAYIDISKEKPFNNRKIIVQNIFDKTVFYKEFELDFSNVDTPVVEAAFSKDGLSLQLTYLSGEEQMQIFTTLDLS